MGKSDHGRESSPPGEGRRNAPSWVIGPTGRRLTTVQLPPAGFKRWLPLRKAEVVAAVRGGLITIDEVLSRYEMTIEEYAGWERSVGRFGVHGLRTTRSLHYKAIHERERKF